MLQRLPRWSIWLLWSLSIVSAWTVSALLAHESGPRSAVGFGIGFGALFAIGTLHAIWTVLGPLSLVVRVPIALVVQAGAAVTAAAIENESELRLDALGLYAGFLFGQYFLAQLPLWFIALKWRWRIASDAEQPGGLAQPDLQFQIRHVMILTAAVAVLLGAARGLIQAFELNASWPDLQLIRIIAFLVLCNTTMMLPIAVAVMIRQRVVFACLIAWSLVLLATVIEVPTFFLVRGRGPGSEVWYIFWAMNVTQAAWVTLSMGILRLGGYRLGARKTERWN